MHKKSYGQHFIHESGVISRILDAVPDSSTVVEVGPGAGALTKGLAEKTNNLHLVEADPELIENLKSEFSQATIHLGDAAKFDFTQFGKDWVFVSNLPYNAAAAILMKILSLPIENRPAELIIMVQKEQGERILDRNESSRSTLSVASQLYAKTELLFHVGPGSFNPPPKVDSSVVKLIPTDLPTPEAEKALSIAKIAFAGRRKQIRKTLKNTIDQNQLQKALTELGYSEAARPQEIKPEDWLKIANYTQS